MANYIPITWANLSFAFILVVLTLLLAYLMKLGLGKDLIWGSFRCFVQLTIMGFVLDYIFASEEVLIILAILGVMILFGAYEGNRRVDKAIPGGFWIALIAICIGITIPLITSLSIIVPVKPWYHPQYCIPLSSMIITSAMNGAALTMNRLAGDIRLRKAQIEAALALGAPRIDAARLALRNSVKSGLIPSVNSLMTVGLVHIPGIMTGQILSGVSPIEAAKYQILIMYMLLATAVVSAIISGVLSTLSFFTGRHQLKYELL